VSMNIFHFRIWPDLAGNTQKAYAKDTLHLQNVWNNFEFPLGGGTQDNIIDMG
jgi:hypothetical protein